MVDQLPAFLLAGLALTGSPGPNTLSLAAAGAAFGARGGAPFLCGIGVGMVAVMGLTAGGVAGLVAAVPGLAPLVIAVAAAYFIHLAYRIATAPPLDAAAPAARRPGFAGGVVLSLFNPKGWAAMASLFAGFVLLPGDAVADAAAKTAVLTAVITAVNVGWLLAGTALTRLFRDPVANRAVNVAFAVLLLASLGVALLV